MVMFIL